MMNFRPRLDEALLRSGEPAANALDRIESERAQGVLIQGVEVRSMMRPPTPMNIRMTIPKKRDNSGTAVLYTVRPDVVGPTRRFSLGALVPQIFHKMIRRRRLQAIDSYSGCRR